MPEFNLAVDVYEGVLHVQEYAPPKTIEPEKSEARFKLALLAIRQVFGLRREQVFIKVRSRQKGNQQYEKQGSQGRFIEVREGEARVLVNLTDYLDTGLFLDHRPLRLRIAQEAKGRHFLNLFAYTGVASLHAALGGAASTTTVDLSPTYLDWAQRNFALNGLAEANHYFEQADCMRWLKDCEFEFDLMFIDPPTFSNSKRTPEVFDVQRDHVELIWLAMRALRAGGALYFSNNFRKFKLDMDALAEFSIEDISRETIGFDFERNPNIHRCWKIQHAS
jgi:23S rRNA (guanine2445-N2)-methyltransferase / 23S rRNA (guanine2069-N7)-methyltransferase